MNTDKTKTLAKSLHTITVLVNVARIIKTAYPHLSISSALYCGMDGLGYAHAPDPHGLRDKALAILTREVEAGNHASYHDDGGDRRAALVQS